MIDFRCDILPLKDIIFRTSLRITMNREDAEDIVQDILLRLWQQRKELDNIKNLEAYAITAARNLALDKMAKHERQNVSIEDDKYDRADEWQQNAHERIEKDERMNAINNIIDSLPEKQKTILQLRDVEEKSYKEISEILSISESDVKVNLFRARKTLKDNYLKKQN